MLPAAHPVAAQAGRSTRELQTPPPFSVLTSRKFQRLFSHVMRGRFRRARTAATWRISTLHHPAVWSFQLALRARGLGSVLTTEFLTHEPVMRSLLGIPDDVTPVVMTPVAYFRGEMGPPPRRPVEEVVFFDRWGNSPTKRRTAPMNQIEERLQQVIDKQDIHDVLMRYCRGVDRCDVQMIDTAFHPDAVDDHIEVGRGETIGQAIVRTLTALSTVSTHLVGNVLIELHGDTADVESYFISYQVRNIEGSEYTRVRAGRYVDRFERRGSDWRIVFRTVVDDWNRLDQVIARSPESVSWTAGSRSHDDPVVLGAEIEQEANVTWAEDLMQIHQTAALYAHVIDRREWGGSPMCTRRTAYTTARGAVNLWTGADQAIPVIVVAALHPHGQQPGHRACAGAGSGHRRRQVRRDPRGRHRGRGLHRCVGPHAARMAHQEADEHELERSRRSGGTVVTAPRIGPAYKIERPVIEPMKSVP